MNERIKDKIDEIEKYLSELYDIFIDDFEIYCKDLRTKAACERYCEKIIEALTDLAFLIIKEKKLDIPEEDTQAFLILSQNKIIDGELAEKLKEAKGMRNILAHEYGEVDDEKVFNAINEQLEEDVEEFIKRIKKLADNSHN